jgi:transcriptional regulator NrdR family protein
MNINPKLDLKENFFAKFSKNTTKTFANIKYLCLMNEKNKLTKTNIYETIKVDMIKKRNKYNPMPLDKDYISVDEAMDRYHLSRHNVTKAVEDLWVRSSTTINCNSRINLTVVGSDVLWYLQSHDPINLLIEANIFIKDIDDISGKKKFYERTNLKEIFFKDTKNGFTDTDINWIKAKEAYSTLKALFEN